MTFWAGSKRGLPSGQLPVVFGLLHHQRRPREQAEISDVIGVRMRQHEVGDVGGLQSEFGKLAGERTLNGPQADLALESGGHRGNLIAKPGIEQQPAIAVLDEIARHRKRAGPGCARRKLRRVVERDVSAVEHVHALDAGFGRLLRERPRAGECRHKCQHGGNEDRSFCHWRFLLRLVVCCTLRLRLRFFHAEIRKDGTSTLESRV